MALPTWHPYKDVPPVSDDELKIWNPVQGFGQTSLECGICPVASQDFLIRAETLHSLSNPLCGKTESVSGNIIVSDYMSVSNGLLSISKVSGSSENLDTAVAGSSGGLFTISSDGSWAFDPGGDFYALVDEDTSTTSVTYHVSDGASEDEGTLTVTVSAASASTLWTPAETTTALWLDAADSDTSESGGILTWEDISGNNNDAQGMTTDRNPSVSTGDLGTCIRLDSDCFILSSEVTARAIFFVCDDLNVVYPNAGATVVPICADGETISVNHVFIRSSDIDDYDISIDGSASNTGTVYVDGTSGVSGGNVDVGLGYDRLNAHLWMVVFDQEIDVGHIWRLRTSTETYYGTGDLYNFIALPAAPSATDIDKFFGWAAHKWGLESLLPSGHPYKSAPPTL